MRADVWDLRLGRWLVRLLVVGVIAAGALVAPLRPAVAVPTDPGGVVTVTPTVIRDGYVLGARASREVIIRTRFGVPTSATAVVLTVTASGSTRPGFLTVHPRGAARPTASSVNFAAGQTATNQVVVPIGTASSVVVYNGSTGTTELTLTVRGYVTGGSASLPGAVVPLTPARILDDPAVAAGSAIQVQATGVGGVPRTGVAAVWINLTATGSRRTGFVAAYPAGEARPETSSLNFRAGATVANLILVPVGDGGKVSLYNGTTTSSVRLVADVAGYVRSGDDGSEGSIRTTAPTRLLDAAGSAAVPGGGSQTVRIAGTAGIPINQVRGVVLTLTTDQQVAAGHLDVNPDGRTRPAAESVHDFAPNTPVATTVVAQVGPAGSVRVDNRSTGSVRLVVDVVGYVVGPALVPDTTELIANGVQPSVGRFQVSDGGATVVYGVDQGSVTSYYRWQRSTQRVEPTTPITYPNPINEPTSGPVVAGSGRYLFYAVIVPGTGETTRIVRYDQTDQTQLTVVSRPDGDVLRWRVSDAGDVVAYYDTDDVYYWTASNQQTRTIGEASPRFWLSMSGDGNTVSFPYLTAGTGPTPAGVWRAASGQLTEMDGMDGVEVMGWDQTGQTAVGISDSGLGTIGGPVYRWTTAGAVDITPPNTSAEGTAYISDDGGTIVYSTSGGTLNRWDDGVTTVVARSRSGLTVSAIGITDAGILGLATYTGGLSTEQYLFHA